MDNSKYIPEHQFKKLSKKDQAKILKAEREQYIYVKPVKPDLTIKEIK